MQSLKNIKWEYVGLLVLACFPIFPFFLVSVAIAIFSLFSVINYFVYKPNRKNSHFNITFFGIQIAFFLFLIVISGFKDGFSSTFKYLEPSISLLIFPIIWFITRSEITKKQQIIILKTFVISSLLLGVYIIGYSSYFSLLNETKFIVLSEEIPVLSVHPHYVGLFFFMIIVILLFKQLNIKKSLQLFLITFFCFLILTMASRAILLVLLLLLAIEFFRKKTTYKNKIIAFLIVVLSISAAVYFIQPLQKKVVEVASAKQFELPNKKWPTSAQIRIGLNYCGSPIINENWVAGVGIITFERILNTCYSKFNNAEKIHYNSHNYYSFLIGSAGVLCLLLFLLMLFWHYKISLKQKNWVYFYFLLLITLSLFTENILSRVYGVVFMLFFMTIFVKTPLKSNQEK